LSLKSWGQAKNTFEHITVEQGLSQSAVLSIAQDSLGFMWFGTKDGLNRYDSKNIEIYRSKANDPKSLSSSININTLLVDSKGFLWVGTQHGLNKYLADSDSFQQYLHQVNNPTSISNDVIRTLFEDNGGNIWVGTEKGLNKILPNGEFERIEIESFAKNGLTNDFIKAIYQDRQGVIWIGTTGGLARMTNSGKNYHFKFFVSDKNNTGSISGNDISAITEDKQGNLWIGTRLKGFNLFDRNKETFTRLDSRSGIGLNSDDVRKITVDKNGKLWIATLLGIHIYNPFTHKIEQHFINEPENSYSLTQNSIYDIYQDKLGSMWIGTYFGGLNITHSLISPFSLYQHFSYRNSLSSNIISAMVEDDGKNLWIGTEGGGLNYFDRKNNRFIEFKHTVGRDNSLSSNLIKDLALDAEGNLWATTFEGGLNVFNTRTRTFKSSSLNSNRLSVLLIDSRQQIWVGTRNGVFIYNKGTGKFNLVKIPRTFVYYIFEDSENRIWVACESGLFLKEAKSKRFVNITLKDNPSWFLRINAISEDSKGKIWFATHNGVLVYTYKDKSVKLYTENQGLPTNTVLGVIEDNQKNIWFSTTKGLAKFEKGIFKIYNKADGLAGNVFNYNSFLKDSKGELFFGGFNGLLSFRPEDIKENKSKPEVILTSLRLSDKPVSVGDTTKILKKAIWQTSKIGIPYNENVFSLDLAVLNYISPEKNRYAYKLEGIDKQWNELQSSNISFNKLSDGDYTLLYKGSNNDGVWSDVKKLHITIYPPFWKSWWAYLFYLTVLAGIAFVSIRYFIMEALLKKEHEIHQLKIDFFRNVSHEIRTPLTLILGPLERLIQDIGTNSTFRNQLLGIDKHVKRLVKLINELLDFSKVEAGRMSLRIERVNLVDFVYDIYQSFQYKAKEGEIEYEFYSENPVIEAYIDQNQLEKVIYNLLSNAFKFTPNNGKIKVKIQENRNDISVRIIDSGKGIAKENKTKIFTDFYQEDTDQRSIGTGIGLALSKSIAKLHKGDLIVEDIETATEFCLILKKGHEHLDGFQFIDDEAYDDDIQTVFSGDTGRYTETEIDIPTILVVEDNKEVRDFVVETLKDRYKMYTAENGSEGLKLAMNYIPDIIISDVMMPVMDGIEFCKGIKTDERTNHIPVILLTARSSEADELEGLKTGADAYITKPFTIDKLKYTVSNMVASQEIMRSKFSRRLSLEPNQPEIEHPDGKFIEKVLHLLEQNIGNPDFGVNDFAYEIGMSTPIFYKKIKAITGLTVNNFMKSFRLKRALQLMEQKQGTISEIAYIVGFTDPKYFSKEFKKQFGKTPTEFISGQ